MAEKRITKNDKFEMIKGILEVAELDLAQKEMLVEFIEKEQDSLVKKSGNKTKTQKENDIIKEVVYAAIARAEEKITVSDILQDVEVANYITEEGKHLTNQKVSALIRLLGNRVVKTIEKKKSYFTVA